MHSLLLTPQHTSSVSPIFAYVPALLDSIQISAHSRHFLKIFLPAGVRGLQVMEYSLRWFCDQLVVPRVPQEILGASDWSTFAPISAIRQPAKGPAMAVPDTKTLTPLRTPKSGYSLNFCVRLQSIFLKLMYAVPPFCCVFLQISPDSR